MLIINFKLQIYKQMKMRNVSQMVPYVCYSIYIYITAFCLK